MGYLIVRRAQKGTSYIAWMEDGNTLADSMVRWIGKGITTEILEYVPNADPRTDPNLIPQLILWGDHIKQMEPANGQEKGN
jgi:hypothetical protein